MGKFKAVIFDMDGVIVDNHHFHVEAWKLFCEKYGIDFTESDFRAKYFGKNNLDILTGLRNKAISSIEVDLWGEEKEALYREIYKNHIKPVEGLFEFINSLKSENIKTAIATSAPTSNLDFVVDSLKIRESFDVIVVAHMISKGKPDPEIYLKTSELLKISPEYCIVFEDSVSGIKSGQNAGMKVIALTTTHIADELPKTELLINNFTEINFEQLQKLF